MKLEEIRSQLLTQLQINLNYWDDVINNTNPVFTTDYYSIFYR